MLVTRLSAAEDAVTMDVLCVDKTGTITVNRLAVTGVLPQGHATESEVLAAGGPWWTRAGRPAHPDLDHQQGQPDPLESRVRGHRVRGDRQVRALATDQGRPSRQPETWDIGGFITVSAALGAAMVAEALLLLWLCWSRFGLATHDDALYTFSFLTLLYFTVFSIVSARERRWFWTTAPSNILVAALMVDALVGTILTLVGLPGLEPIPWWQTLTILGYAMVSCLVVNDSIKVAMIQWRVPAAVAGQADRLLATRR